MLALVLIALVFAEPWVLQQGWNWHVVPTFGLAPIRYGTAWALAVLANLVTHQYIPRPDDAAPKFAGFHAVLTVVTLFVLWVTR